MSAVSLIGLSAAGLEEVEVEGEGARTESLRDGEEGSMPASLITQSLCSNEASLEQLVERRGVCMCVVVGVRMDAESELMKG